MAPLSKRNAILKVASKLFMTHGYRKVSMDEIAAAIPVSKPTLYNHFVDKKALFAAVITLSCETLLTSLKETSYEEMEPSIALWQIGKRFLSMVLSEEALQLLRIISAEYHEFPEMAELFYSSGPNQTHQLLTNYLQKQHEKDALYIPNPHLAASMFLSMLKGYVQMKCLLGLKNSISKEEMEERIAYSIDVFLKGHLPLGKTIPAKKLQHVN